MLEAMCFLGGLLVVVLLALVWRERRRTLRYSRSHLRQRRDETIEVEPAMTLRGPFKTSADNVTKGGKCPRKENFQFGPPVSSHLCVDRGGVRDEQLEQAILSGWGDDD